MPENQDVDNQERSVFNGVRKRTVVFGNEQGRVERNMDRCCHPPNRVCRGGRKILIFRFFAGRNLRFLLLSCQLPFGIW